MVVGTVECTALTLNAGEQGKVFSGGNSLLVEEEVSVSLFLPPEMLS